MTQDPAPGFARTAEEAAIARFVHERFMATWLGQNRATQWGLLAAGSLLTMLWYAATPARAPLLWFCVFALASALRYTGTTALLRGRAEVASLRRVGLLLAVHGSLLATPLVAFGAMTPLQRAALSIVLIGAATASVNTTLGYRSIFLAFAAPMLVPLGLAWMLTSHPPEERLAVYGMGTLVLLYLLYLVGVGRRAYAVFEEACRFRYGEQQLNRELTQAIERIGETNRAKTQFLAAASHDLRQPIHSLNVLVAALGLRALDERSREIVGLLDAVNQSMSKQLDGLLDISKLDAGTVQPELVALRLDKLAAAHHAAMLPVALERGLEFVLDAPDEVSVRSDATLLTRTLSNLTDNAFKFTPAGGRVAVVVRRDGDDALLRVTDGGIGIAADEHERVFREFYQVSNVERDRSKGLGLGLSIVQRLCALLGIRLQLDSQPGRGTSISLRLPLAEPASEVAAPVAPDAQALPPGLAVLVIDDELAVRSSMKLLLDELGCTVHLADSTEAARRIAAAHPIDVVLSDFRLREGDSGVAALRTVRHLHPHVRAALVTGDTAPNRLRDAQWAGVALLHKPVRLEELMAVLRPST
jgi:signal transduction histidine kinase/CheY-like chemotaxis protein